MMKNINRFGNDLVDLVFAHTIEVHNDNLTKRAYLIFNQNMDNTSSERLAEIADRFNTHCDAGNTQEAQASFDNMQGIIQQQIFEAQNSVQETSKG
ncbi:unnamed protein product [Rotaria magnacalcarata]